MSRREKQQKNSAEKTVREAHGRTRRRHSSGEKIRIVLEGLRGEASIAELCRKEEVDQCLASVTTPLTCFHRCRLSTVVRTKIGVNIPLTHVRPRYPDRHKTSP